jgi:hypothetical protein
MSDKTNPGVDGIGRIATGVLALEEFSVGGPQRGQRRKGRHTVVSRVWICEGWT